MNNTASQTARLIGLVSALSLNVFAQANAGVSDERVNLPEAPGSIDGVGENAAAEGNKGALTYRVAVELPQGFPGVTPTVDLNYNSGGGSDILGIGWSMATYSIERMTSKGLQKYDTEDRFVVEGSEELVAIAGGTATAAVYRSRFESGFVRYTWVNRGTGENGYWKAEYPDGRVGYYGADATGTAVTTAQVQVPGSSPTKTFRWHLVSMVDRYGHAMNATWTKDSGGASLLERLDYLYDNGQPRHSVRFVYEARPDLISDAKPGFEMRLTQRLKEIRIFSGVEPIRAYVMTYEDMATAGGLSRLTRVARLGRNSVAYPVTFNFGYSKTLGGTCDASCEKPFVKDMGAIPNADFGQGRATLLDMNGDALPDVVYSTQNGVHSFYYSKLDGEGRTSFNTTASASARTVGSSAFVLGSPGVQVIDVNGDGFVDITQPRTNDVLCNNGTGDWQPRDFCVAPTVPGFDTNFDGTEDADPVQQDPKYVRFFDFDNDKRIDWLRTLPGGTTTQVLHNQPTGYVGTTVSNIGAVFDESTLQLADMNGDGLQDPVQIVTTGATVQVQYKLNLGFGRWSGPDWNVITLSGLDASQATKAELQDINGDTLADVVAVTTNEVLLAINRNGTAFAPVQTIRSADLGAGAIPTLQTGTVVSYADMNGNGSDDIVWIQPSGGAVQYLELFPVRPNLISRIDNGIGSVQRVTYGTSINEQARDAAANKPWVNKVPNPMTLVTAMESFVTLTGSDMNGAAAPSGLRERILYRYHSGYYDGLEKQFRGYEGVDRELVSDMSRDAQEPGLIVEAYDVGKPDTMGTPRPLFAGLMLRSETWGGVPLTKLRESRDTYEACAVTGAPTFFACRRATTTLIVERDEARAVTQRQETDYDGYGNVIATRDLGVVNKGTPEQPSACDACTASGVFGDPCGAMCMGDERYSVREYIAPGPDTGDRWVIGWIKREANGAVANMYVDETRTYYDAPDFEGQPLGKLTLGGVSRVERRNGPGANDFLTVDRFRRDAHGNVVESIAPNGSMSNTMNFRRLYTMEPAGLKLLSLEIRTGGTAAPALRQDFGIDYTWEELSQSSNQYPVMGSTPLSTPQLTRYRYDEHGRLSRVYEPGDPEAAPSKEMVYTLADPASRVLINARSSTSGGNDIVTARCFDGRGRMFQRRTKLSDTAWHVDGFTEFDARGKIARKYQPFRASSGACDVMPPMNVPSVTYRYDALGRVLSETESQDGSVRKNEYRPLTTRRFDEDDNDMSNPSFDTPEVETFDGLGRLTSITRMLSAGGGGAATTRFNYDAYGMLAVSRDAAGHTHTQTYDPMGRLLRVDDSNGGTTRYSYDANGNRTEIVDGRGKVTKQEYDGANRIVARFDPADDANTRTTWQYDRLEGCTECTNAGGQLVRATWPGSNAGEDRFGYDQSSNLAYVQRTLGGVSFVTRRRYDQDDRQLSVTFPDGTTLNTTYDGAGRTSTIGGVIDGIDYTDRGELGTVRFSNGAQSEYGYDGRVRLSSIKTRAKDGSELLSLGYTRTRAGDLTAIDDGALAGRVRHAGQFTVDAWGRLTRAVLPGAAGDPETLDFTFDNIDNVLGIKSSLGAQSRAHVGDLGYDATRPNAVSTAGAVALTYDEAGGVISRGERSFTRDHLGRITAVSGPLEATYSYDFAERVAKQEGDSTTWYIEDDFELRDGIAVIYARLGEVRVARFESDALAASVLSDLAPATGAGTLSVTGDGTIDIADAWLAQAAGAGVVQLSGGPTPSAVGALLSSAARRLLMEDVTTLHGDHIRSVVVATNGDGALRGEQSFYPTGTVRAQSGFVDHRGFTGQEFDEATGLLHFRMRDLDPRTGRWDRPDPAYLEQDQGNVRYLGQSGVGYAYVANAFVSTFDPTGLDTPTKESGASSPKAKDASASASASASSSAGADKAKADKPQVSKGAERAKMARKIGLGIAIVSALASIASSVMTAAGVEGANHVGTAAKIGSAIGTVLKSGADMYDKKAEASSGKETPATEKPAAEPPVASTQMASLPQSARADDSTTATATTTTAATSSATAQSAKPVAPAAKMTLKQGAQKVIGMHRVTKAATPGSK